MMHRMVPLAALLAAALLAQCSALWDAQLETSLSAGGITYNTIDWAGAADRIASCERTGDISVWDVSSLDAPTLIRSISNYHTDVKAFALSPDGTKVAMAKWSTVWVWSVDSGAQLASATVPSTDSTLDWDSTSTFVAGASPIEIWVLDSTDSSVTQWSHWQEGTLYAVAYSADGTMLATGSADDTVKVWRVSDGAQLQRLTGHTANVHDVSFSPDGTMVASSDGSGQVIIWLVSNGSQVGSMTGLGVVRSVEWSSGSVLATGGEDSKARAWDVSTPSSPALLYEVTATAGVWGLSFGATVEHLAVMPATGSITLFYPSPVDPLPLQLDVTIAVRGAVTADATAGAVAAVAAVSAAYPTSSSAEALSTSAKSSDTSSSQIITVRVYFPDAATRTAAEATSCSTMLALCAGADMSSTVCHAAATMSVYQVAADGASKTVCGRAPVEDVGHGGVTVTVQL